MYYIFKEDGVCVCSCDYEVNNDDLASRNELAVQSEEDYEISAIKLVDGIIVAIEPKPPTEEEIQAQLERGVEAWMNTVVAERGYDSIDTCIARYTDSPNPKYAQEAKAVKNWNTLVWDKCWDILKEVKEGKRAIPTLEEVIAELPVLVW